MRYVMVLAVTVVGAGSLKASIITYVTPDNSTAGGQPVSAEAKFTTGADSITVVLTNLQANPTSVVQNLSDLIFTVSTGQKSGSISSSSALERSVAKNNTYSDGAVVDTGWSLTTQGSSLYLNVLGTKIGPAHLIIGPPGGATYAKANGSIAGNGPHNPFLAESATFVLNVPGVTAASTITAATFSFGTTEGANEVPGEVVPEPATLALAASGLAAVIGAVVTRRRRR
ncbi:MAG: PEP-CTERM sorting domain-containing protein [Pirellulales bacterium]|nr:PEP-CTERM sorting domain-containing protein [Pirellulales bacterium]